MKLGPFSAQKFTVGGDKCYSVIINEGGRVITFSFFVTVGRLNGRRWVVSSRIWVLGWAFTWSMQA